MLTKWFSSATLQLKVLLLVAASTLFVLLGSGIRMTQQANLARETTKKISTISQNNSLVSRLELLEKTQVELWFKQALMGQSSEAAEKLRAKTLPFRNKFEDILKSTSKAFDAKQADLARQVLEKHQALCAKLDDATIRFFIKKDLSLDKVDELLDAPEREVMSVLNDLEDAMTDSIAEQIESSDRVIKKSFQSSVAGAGVFALLAIILISLVLRSINRSFIDIVKELTDASSTVAGASGQILDSSNQLSTAVNKQAASVQQTVASMTEMSGMLTTSSSNARICKELSAEANMKSKVGKDIMQEMVNSMSAIEASNAQLQNMISIIEDISAKTTVINDIVFKTQILSFNASIEAKSAGQYGRGFSVIAGEVGGLAQLSGNAAKEINGLLENSQRNMGQILSQTGERVKEGRAIVNRALNTFNEISDDIQSISSQVQGISEATREQEEGIKQTSQALLMIDEATQQAARVATQAQEASVSLGSQSRDIVSISARIRALILGSGSPKRISRSSARSNIEDGLSSLEDNSSEIT